MPCNRGLNAMKGQKCEVKEMRVWGAGWGGRWRIHFRNLL